MFFNSPPIPFFDEKDPGASADSASSHIQRVGAALHVFGYRIISLL
jgi:hypothetical protein